MNVPMEGYSYRTQLDVKEQLNLRLYDKVTVLTMVYFVLVFVNFYESNQLSTDFYLNTLLVPFSRNTISEGHNLVLWKL